MAILKIWLLHLILIYKKNSPKKLCILLINITPMVSHPR